MAELDESSLYLKVIWYVLTLYFHLQLGLSSDLFAQGFLTKTVNAFHLSAMCAIRHTHIIPLDLITLNSNKQKVQIMKFSLIFSIFLMPLFL
jgi:hypothetical protein